MGNDSYKSDLLTIIIFCVISVPYIADLVLSIKSYQEECKTYYIIRFVTQGISLLLIIIFPFLFMSQVYEQHTNPYGLGFILLISLVYLIIAILPMEITSLVFFIRDYELLFYLGKIGYYIHACSIILDFILLVIKFNYIIVHFARHIFFFLFILNWVLL